MGWLLSSCGYSLIHDDIFPIFGDNRTQQVNTLSVTRIESDKVLKQYGLHHAGKPRLRNNQNVRFRRIDKTHDISDVKKTVVIFVNFAMTPVETKIVPLETVNCLQKLISEECLITDRTITNLSFLFDWFCSHQYFEITYSDFTDVPKLLNEILDETR